MKVGRIVLIRLCRGACRARRGLCSVDCGACCEDCVAVGRPRAGRCGGPVPGAAWERWEGTPP